ncbi:SDR family oxidoreductase [Agarilytica rhodophyticola]|uniref:SDR family oxidoreductase n=1 Tax=Agarilytica rhodophyticola TaxID=1737490 RepID=UPI000B3428C1|nr:SDR family oxidoreductase [Agarilytica rhodophyticola]
MESFTDQEFRICLKVLQAVCSDTNLADNEPRFKSLIAKINKQAKREKNRLVRKDQQKIDRLAIDSTERVRLEKSADNVADISMNNNFLLKPIRCYICKTKYQFLDSFYHRLCPACAKHNHQKRSQKACLKKRIAIVTGGRIKIGYELVLKLLRDGATVVATTRFPLDAMNRLMQEKDFVEFQDRIQFYGLDLRHMPSVDEFIQHIHKHYTHIDILINNAAQTIKRPNNFYEELYIKESAHMLDIGFEKNNLIAKPNRVPSNGEWVDRSLFPAGEVDRFLQPLDKRSKNSWVEKLDSVSRLEFVESQVINYFSPFFLTSSLKHLLIKSPFPDRYIVNVSAMEGQFSRKSKTYYHPHTNMAKAALNMMTRTSASDYAESGIYMNSVDTGWITQENPYPKAQSMEKSGFVPPLDEIDGAARVYDPIVQGTLGNQIYGLFLKDYEPYAW